MWAVKREGVKDKARVTTQLSVHGVKSSYLKSVTVGTRRVQTHSYLYILSFFFVRDSKRRTVCRAA